MGFKKRYALQIVLCFFHVISHGMLHEEKSFACARELRGTMQIEVDKAVRAGVLTTRQEIYSAIKTHLSDYLREHGVGPEAEKVAARARGFYALTHAKKEGPLELMLPHKRIQSIWIDTEDSDAVAIYVAEGDGGSVSIWKRQDLTWACTDNINIAGTPFVRCVRAVKPNPDVTAAERIDRIAIEINNTAPTGEISKLHLYAKMLVKDKAGNRHEWQKQDYRIKFFNHIKSYAFSPDAFRCAILNDDKQRDKLTLFERSGNEYNKIAQIDVGKVTSQLLWKNQSRLIVPHMSTCDEVKVEGRNATIRPVTDENDVRNIVFARVLGWKISHDRASTITIDNPLAAIANYLYIHNAKKHPNTNNNRSGKCEVLRVNLSNAPPSQAKSNHQKDDQKVVVKSQGSSSGNKEELDTSSSNALPVQSDSKQPGGDKSVGPTSTQTTREAQHDTVDWYTAFYKDLKQVADIVPGTIRFLEKGKGLAAGQ